MTNMKRVQIDLAEQSMARLQNLKEETDAASYAEVVRNALRLYEAVVREAKAGNKFLVEDPSGRLKEYLVF